MSGGVWDINLGEWGWIGKYVGYVEVVGDEWRWMEVSGGRCTV